ncbi:hemopexin repeat-containing protein [Streptomyces sp. NPDC014892]|uniref:hemopexin repeat-containing protein n=1 Tax=Streptomyces sp. NPDC014892 TaxID=3364930 RepID=UPI003702F9A7
MPTDAQQPFYRQIDAIVRSQADGAKCWILKDSQYTRYDLAEDTGDWSAPKPIDGNWKGLPAHFTRGIDAAVTRRDKPTVAYLFKDDQYVRYDLQADRADDGYPKSIEGNWRGLPAHFTRGIDAVVSHHTDPVVLWIFKDDQYVRYNISDDELLAGPKRIADGWSGLPDSFQRGIDAAVTKHNEPTKVYLFKDDHYVRYDLEADRTDDGYPKTIVAEWDLFS